MFQLWLLLIPVLGMILQGCFIMVEHQKKFVAADILKGSAALCFVLFGLIGYLTVSKDPVGLKLVIGLIFGMFGDILLNLRFVIRKYATKIFLVGIVSFLVGHILYLAALAPNAKHPAAAILIGACIAGALLVYVYLTMQVKVVFKIFGIVYLGAVFIMTAIACDIALTTMAVRDIVYAIGAVLFTLSDVILIFYTFGGEKYATFPRRISNLSLYYLGQLLIAGSLFLPYMK